MSRRAAFPDSGSLGAQPSRLPAACGTTGMHSGRGSENVWWCWSGPNRRPA